MIPSGLSNNNRVKSITSRFEVLKDQTKYGETDVKLQNITTVPINLKKITTSKENVTHKPQTHKYTSDSLNNGIQSKHNNSKDHLGASSNYGNRKRLKECEDNSKHESHSTEKDIKLSNYMESKEHRSKSVNDDVSFDDVKENISVGNQKSLTRQHSDPVKKLHRSPAFRCDRSEKLKDSRKNSFNSDCSDQGVQCVENDRCRLSRDKLKRLGLLLEEKMKQDQFEFSKPKNKSSCFKLKDSDDDSVSNKSLVNDSNISSVEEKTKLQNIKEQLKPIVCSGVSKNNKTNCSNNSSNNVNELVNEDLQIPKHILDQYAQVIKPKNRNAFVKKSPTAKGDAVLSDSGVSSESENLISDDLEENETSPKLKNFKAIRSNFEIKNNTQAREDIPSRRKFIRRSSDDKKSAENLGNNSSKENLIVNESVNGNHLDNDASYDNKSFSDRINELTPLIVNDPSSEIDVSDNTLKRVLKQPLPPGPPPKKPPRTFASNTPNSPTKANKFENKSPDQGKPKIKDSKIKYKNRTKEESKIMLQKIENALYHHENGGKILSPRPVRKESQSNSETSMNDSWSRQATKPSIAKLKKTNKKNEIPSDSKPKELHYMCTEIFDLNGSDMEKSKLNSSNASINSAESFQTTNSFTKCFNSLNCTNNSMKYSSGVNYMKLDTSPNSIKNSINDICCSCNFTSPKDKSGSSKKVLEELSISPPNQMRRLSTFMPSPSKSIENLNTSFNTCEACGNNPSDQFVCHINNSNLSNRSFSPNSFLDEPKSVFFVDRKYDSRPEGMSHYGVLKKCKSQEHIYAEPLELKRTAEQNRNKEPLVPKSKSSANVPVNSDNAVVPPLIRMRTQLEDGFGKFREVDSTKVKSQRGSFKTVPALSSRKGDVDMSDNNVSERLDNIVIKDDKSDSVSIDSKDSNKVSKVKDILMRLESGRASLRIEKYKRTEDIRKSLAVRSNKTSNLTNFVTFRKNSDSDGSGLVSLDAESTRNSAKNLHYSSSTIYDTPTMDDNISVGSDQDIERKADNSIKPLAVNSSFLYCLENAKQTNNVNETTKEGSPQNSVFRRPPMYERKVSTIQNSNLKAKRPHSLYLLDNGRVTQNNGVVAYTETRRRRSPTEVDKEHLSRLMTEIYDTVAEACILEGNSAPPSSGDSEHDTSDDVSLKLTRSLTEKRKRYVKRVTSRVGFLSEDSGTRILRQKSVDDDGSEDIQQQDTDTSKAYSTFPSRQSIKNVSFLHSNINREKMSESSGRAEGSVEEGGPNKEIIIKGGGLFEACILVGMNFSTGQAYIKNIYPEMVVIPPQIESLVFPESVPSNMSCDTTAPKCRPMRICDEAPHVQCYALVLTNERGLRTYGYCRRVLPEGATHCLPLTYCIISRHRAPSFYYKILQEIESRHGSADNVVNSVLSQLYSAEFPKPGYSVTIKQIRSPKRLVVNDGSFKKNTPYRNSVNLGDVFKSSSYDALNGTVSSESSSQSLLVDRDGDKFRRKGSSTSANFSVLNENLSVMKSLEKIYGENLKEFKINLIESDIQNEGTSDTMSIDRELESRSSHLNLKSSSDNSSENLASETSEGYRNDSSFHDTDTEEPMARDYNYSTRSAAVDVVHIKRPLEPRLDEDNLSVLFESISVSNLVKIFGTLIIERKVVIVCDKLSQLSSCIEALQSILYPLTWQHTLVSSIPRDMTRDILEAPIPILAGLLLPLNNTNTKHSHSDLDKMNFDEGMLIDISNGEERLIKIQGDESTLLPPLLAKTLKASLQLGPPITTPSSLSDEHSRKTRNVLVAEAFLRFFVEVLGDCKKYIVEKTSPADSPTGSKGKYKFDKEQYIKSFRSKHVQYFLEWFTETAMFNTYIQQRMLLMATEGSAPGLMDLPYPDFYEIFDERVCRRGSTQSARAQLSNVGKEGLSKGNYKMIVNKKVKVWRDKLRDLVS